MAACASFCSHKTLDPQKKKENIHTLLPQQHRLSWPVHRKRTFPQSQEESTSKKKSTHNESQISYFVLHVEFMTIWGTSCFTWNPTWCRRYEYLSHTGTAKPFSLSLSTRSMTAACQNILALIRHVIQQMKTETTFTFMILYRRRNIGVQGQQLQNCLQKLWDAQTYTKIRVRTNTNTSTDPAGDVFSYHQLVSLLDHKHKWKMQESLHQQELEEETKITVSGWLSELQHV